MAGKYWWRDEETETVEQDSSKTTSQPENKYWWRDEKTTSTGASGQNQDSGAGKYWWRADSANTVGENLTNRVNTWLENHNNYITNYQTRNSGRKFNYEDSYVSDSADWLNTISQQKSAFDTEADSILAQLDQYKGYFNDEWVESIRKTLTDARSAQDIILENSTKDNEWWSSFGNEELVNTFGSAEDAYKYYQRSDGYRQKYAGQKYDDIQKALSTLEDGEEKDWLTNNQYEFYKDDTNYNSKSRSGWKSFEAQKIAEWKEEESKTWFDKALESFATTPADTSLPNAGLINAQVAYTNDTTYREPNEKWSADQRNQFGYLWATDRDKAYEYAVQVNSQIADYEEYLAQQGAQQDATKNGWTMTGHTIGAIASAPLALGDLLGDLVEYSARGTITSDGMLSPFEYSQAVQSGIANKLNKVDDNGVAQSVLPDWVPIVGGKGWGDVYSLGVSAANSLVSAYTLGGFGTLVNFIGQGGASGVDEALSRGASPGQALLYGAIVGAAEGVTEMINADNLLKIGSSATLKNYLLKALNQGFGETVEEGASSVIGNIADAIIMQDKSNFNASIKEYMDSGMSEEEAKKKAWIDMVEGVAFDALGGFVSGFASGSIQGGVSTAIDASKGNQANIDAVKKYGGNTDALIQEGLQNDKKSDSYKLAEKYRQQIVGTEKKAGKAMTGFQIRNLLAANQEQVTKADLEKIQDAAANRLAQVGQREDIYKIAELATKYATGQEMTRAERSTLARSSFGSQVASELLDGIHPDKLLSKWENDMSEESGAEYSTDWTGEIGTESDKFLRYNNEKLVRTILEKMASTEDPATYKSLESRMEAEESVQVSDTGKSVIRGTEQEVDLAKPTFKEITEDGAVLEANGESVNANAIDYSDADLGYAIKAVGKIENITPEAAGTVVSLVDMTKPVVAQMNALDEAFTYGFHNYSEADLKAGLFTKNLTEQQLNDAYKLGQYVRGKSDVDADAPRTKMRTEADAKMTAEQKTAKQKARIESDDVEVYYISKKDGKSTKFTGTYDPKRMAAVNTAKFLSKLKIGGKYYFYESYVNANDERVYKDANGVEKKAPNGMYMDADGSIWIDLNAGDEGEGTALFTLGHELTHFVKAQSKKQFKILADLVKEAFDKTDMSMHKRVLAKQKFLENARNGEAVSYDEAYEEVVADAMSTMLTDGSLHEKLMEIKVKDKGLFNTIKRFFEKMIAKFREVYAELTPDQRDARDIREMKDMFDKIQTAFAEALVEASDNFQAALEAEAVESLGENAKVETNAAGELLIAANERGNVQVYSERTYLEGGREKLEKALRQNGHTKEEIEKTLSYVDDALDYIKILAAGYAKNMGYTNLSNHLLADIVTNVKTGKQVMSAIVNNGDYPVNIDLSLICKKRVAYMNLMGRLIRDGVFDKVNYDGAAIAEVNEILRENGFETACLGCFVESRRLQFQTWAETIVSEWNSEVEKRNPNAGSFGFAKGKMENLTDADIDALTRELESVKKNDQGNVNLGQGNSVTRMGRLLDALPSLQKKLTVEDLLTPEGLTALRKHDGSLFSIVKSRYGAASPKIVQDFNPYASEIAMLTFAQVKGITNNAVKGAQAYVTEVKNEYGKLKKDKGESKAAFDQRKKDHEQKIQDEAMRRYLYDIGGARIQSFSDFMIENVFDYIQIFADLAAKRLPLHGYTKEIVCMRLFGMTGAKWNGSLIAHVERSMGKEYAGLLPAGTKDGIPVTVNGKDYVIGFDDYARNVATGGKSFVQSIGMKDVIALQLDPRYSPYVGNITIGVSDAQILAMLDSPLFRMVIPYHASGMLPQFAKLVGVDMYNDYTDYQNTTVRQYYDLDGKAVSELKNAKGEAVKADTSYAFNAEVQKTKDAKIAANNYLKWCAQRHPVYDGSKLVGYATFNPKFSSSPYGTDFTRHENYYKLLEDFNTYDCITEASTVQGAVTMNFPSEANRLTEQQMAAYKQALRETGIFTEKDIEKYAKKADMTFKEIIAAEVGNRANYEASQMPKWDATVKAVEAKLQNDYARDEKRSERVTAKQDRDYLAAVKNGDMKTVQKMVDEASENAGFGVRGHHGTTNLFYVFDTAKSNIENDWGRGIYATTSEEDAEANYASDDGADLTNRIERLAEMMENWEEYEDMDYEQRIEAARKQLSQGLNKTLNVAFRMENPVIVERGTGGTFFTYESEYDEDLDEYSEPSGTLIDLIEGMKDIINEDYEWASYDADKLDNLYEEAVDFGGLSAIQVQSSVADWLVDVTDEDGNMAHNEILRAALERMGYDGIVDKSVPYKFGALSGRRFGGMSGVVEGTTHYIAFNSSQVKLTDPVTYDDSGNVIPLSERFNPENKDIRYSERDSDGKQLTKEQQEFFKDSVVRDENGNLLAVYHGTDADFTVFEANKDITGEKYYFAASRTWVKNLFKEEKYHSPKNIMRVYLNIKNPLDLRSAPYVMTGNEWIDYFDSIGVPISKRFREFWSHPSKNKISFGSGKARGNITPWHIFMFDGISGGLRDTLASMGYDGLVIYDKVFGKADNTAYVAFHQNQIKLTSNKKPTTDPDTRYSVRSSKVDTDGMSAEAKKIISNLEIRARFSGISKGEYASYSAERIERELSNSSSATQMDYAKSYIAWVNPMDFLYATTTSDAGRAQIEKEAGELDLERLRKQTQPIHLTVDFETGKIVGHEGRHRMIALHKAGVEKVAVIFDAWNDDRHNTKPVDMMMIGGQEFDRYHGGLDFFVHDMLPLSKRYADAAKKLFSEVSGSVKFSERGGGTSNRSLLANAFEGITNGSDEYKLIQKYKGYIAELNSLEEKLSEMNAQIRKIRFGKGEYDAEKLARLESEAKKIAEAISKYDQYLLSLEASEPLRKVIERERKKEAQKTRDHVKEIQQNKKVRAEQTELRHKIRKAIRDLDKILKHGNKKTNVKEDMKSFASKALELADYLFTDHISNDDLIRKGITVRMTEKEAALVEETEDILSKLYDNADSLTDEEFTRLDAKRKANEDKLRDLLKAQRNERLNTPVYNLFNDLVTEYASLKNSKQDSVKAAYDEVLENSLRAFMGDEDRVKILKNMRVADMTTEELNWLYRAYTMVLTNVRNANKFHVKGMAETIEQMAGRVAGDFSSRKIPDKKLAIAAQKLVNKLGWGYEKLYYALDRIGSEAFTELIMNIADSENTVMQDVKEAIAFRDKIVENYGFNNWSVNKEIDREFMDNSGKKFKMTLGQLMSLYAYSRRDGAWDHIEYGGFVFGEAALTNPRPADSYKLSKEQCEAITSLLTKEQKRYVEDMQKYLSETMGAKGNEVSMLLYGIKMFGEKNYFPIHVAGQFKAQANESQAKKAAGFESMTNAGFTHAQNPNAKAPFVLEGFNEIWTDHVNEMSRYHGTVPALEDMRRVMNRSSYSESGMESMAIKQLMENSYGKEAVEYFDNLYREANSGAITDKLQKNSKKLLSLFRKNSVAYSLSVLIQQPAAMVRAYDLIDRKYFGFKGFGTLTSGIAKAVSDKWTKAHTNAYNEMLKYAPGVTMAKEIGGFDTATGGSIRSYLLDTSKSLSQKWKTGTAIEKGSAVMDLVDNNAVANLPNLADKIAWIEIWNACKRETVAKHKDLATNSEEFMQAVGERFTEVIRATQVYDSIFAKSPMLKSKNLAVQYLVSFMNEPNTVANMVEKAVRDATKGDWKSGAKTAAVVVHSIIFTNVLKSLVYAMRDDDEDETYIEKYIEAVTGNMMSDFFALNYIPIARDVVSLAQGYDVERADMAIVADALDALNRVIKNGFTETDDMTEEQLVEFDKKCTEANWKLVESVAAFFGIPVKNIRREIEGVINTAKNTAGNNGQTTLLSAWEKVYDAVIESIPFMQVKNTKQDKLYEAIMAGDQAYLSRLKSTYKDDSAYQSAVRKALRENDSRIHDAAQAKYEGRVEEYKRIFREIQKEGKFSFDDIMSAVNSEESAIRNKLEPDKVTSSYTASDFVESIVLGDSKSAEAMKDDIIATKVANGKTQAEAEKEFISSVATGIRDAYSSGLLDEAGAEKMLMEYADKDEEEAASKVGYWGFCEDNPKYDYFTESNVKDYREFAEPENISLDVYAQFINGTKGLADIKDKWGDVEVTKREQVLEVIDSLPLTWQQKDALYLAAGYSESKIWDVPW